MLLLGISKFPYDNDSFLKNVVVELNKMETFFLLDPLHFE